MYALSIAEFIIFSEVLRCSLQDMNCHQFVPEPINWPQLGQISNITIMSLQYCNFLRKLNKNKKMVVSSISGYFQGIGYPYIENVNNKIYFQRSKFGHFRLPLVIHVFNRISS